MSAVSRELQIQKRTGSASHLGICGLAMQEPKHGRDELAQRLKDSSAKRYSSLSRRLSMQAGAPMQYLHKLPNCCPLPAICILLSTKEVADHVLCCMDSKQDPLQCTWLLIAGIHLLVLVEHCRKELCMPMLEDAVSTGGNHSQEGC